MKIYLLERRTQVDPAEIHPQFCAKCDRPMEVLSIKRMLNGAEDQDVTFCCLVCYDEVTVTQPAPPH